MSIRVETTDGVVCKTAQINDNIIEVTHPTTGTKFYIDINAQDNRASAQLVVDASQLFAYEGKDLPDKALSYYKKKFEDERFYKRQQKKQWIKNNKKLGKYGRR